MNRRRWFIRMGIVAVVGVALLVWTISQGAQARLTIENQSGQAIDQLRITIAGQTSMVKNLPNGRELSAPLGDKAGAPCEVRWQFADGGIHRFASPATAGTLTILPRGETRFKPSGKN
jgi:hypothetical protein